MGPAYCQLAVVIFPLAHGPQHPKRRLSWLKKTNLKRRTDERQNTQREKHATAQRQRAHVHSSHAAHAAGAPFAAHPAPNRAGRPCRALLYVPRGVNLDLTCCGGTVVLEVGVLGAVLVAGSPGHEGGHGIEARQLAIGPSPMNRPGAGACCSLMRPLLSGSAGTAQTRRFGGQRVVGVAGLPVLLGTFGWNDPDWVPGWPLISSNCSRQAGQAAGPNLSVSCTRSDGPPICGCPHVVPVHPQRLVPGTRSHGLWLVASQILKPPKLGPQGPKWV